MFTGIIEELGIVDRINRKEKILQLGVKAQVTLESAAIGDSISVNGVCLTIANITNKTLFFDIMTTTLESTNLGKLKAGDKVNLERALKLAGRLDGHIVTGHVDGIGLIRKKSKEKESFCMEIGVPSDIMEQLVPKGSIAVDGINLTIGEIFSNSFTVFLIPHTLKVTTLEYKVIGDAVNIEVDMLGKYVRKFIANSVKDKNKITEKFLKEGGFI